MPSQWCSLKWCNQWEWLHSQWEWTWWLTTLWWTTRRSSNRRETHTWMLMEPQRTRSTESSESWQELRTHSQACGAFNAGTRSPLSHQERPPLSSWLGHSFAAVSHCAWTTVISLNISVQDANIIWLWEFPELTVMSSDTDKTTSLQATDEKRLSNAIF